MYTPTSLTEVGVLGELETTSESITTASADLYALRVKRDALVLKALELGSPYRQLQRITGLSRAALIKIQNSPRVAQ